MQLHCHVYKVTHFFVQLYWMNQPPFFLLFGTDFVFNYVTSKYLSHVSSSVSLSVCHVTRIGSSKVFTVAVVTGRGRAWCHCHSHKVSSRERHHYLLDFFYTIVTFLYIRHKTMFSLEMSLVHSSKIAIVLLRNGNQTNLLYLHEN